MKIRSRVSKHERSKMSVHCACTSRLVREEDKAFEFPRTRLHCISGHVRMLCTSVSADGADVEAAMTWRTRRKHSFRGAVLALKRASYVVATGPRPVTSRIRYDT
jgi:hypothetical protein